MEHKVMRPKPTPWSRLHPLPTARGVLGLRDYEVKDTNNHHSVKAVFQ